MGDQRTFPAILLLTVAAALSITAHAQSNQQANTQPPANPIAHRIPYSRFKEIYIDDSCRLLPGPLQQAPGTKKPRLHRDPVICHLESELNSNHIEETIAGNELHRSNVSVTEHTYVLQNVTTGPAVFVVEQFVPEGWQVDSDPQPEEMSGPTAVFRAYAQPGEIVHLHVGMRHTKPMRTKFIKNSPLPPSRTTGN